jgi:hypothetical protein
MLVGASAPRLAAVRTLRTEGDRISKPAAWVGEPDLALDEEPSGR